jgi:hypothetical protein
VNPGKRKNKKKGKRENGKKGKRKKGKKRPPERPEAIGMPRRVS